MVATVSTTVLTSLVPAPSQFIDFLAGRFVERIETPPLEYAQVEGATLRDRKYVAPSPAMLESAKERQGQEEEWTGLRVAVWANRC